MFTMKMMVVGMMIQDSRDQKVWKVVEKNSKCKTVILEDAEGKTQSMGIATLNKYFDNMNIQEAPEPVAAVTEEVKTEEIVPAKKEKKERKSRQKKEKFDTIGMVRSVLDTAQIEYTAAPCGDGINVKKDGKTIVKIWRRSDKVRIYVNENMEAFAAMNKELVENIAPSTTPGKLNVSMYAPIASIEKVVLALVK